MAWIESHDTLGRHPKKDRLAELLMDGTVPSDVADLAAIGLLHRLWWWALDYADDGDLSKYSDRQIARGCEWSGDAAALVAALTQAGLLNEDRTLHDWTDYTGRLVGKREANRRRARAAYAQTARRLRTDDEHSAGLPTVPNSTEPNQPRKNPPTPQAKRQRTPAKTDDEWIEERDALLGEAWFPDALVALADIIASGNKTKTVAPSRVVNEIVRPLVTAQESLTREALAYGLGEALTRGIGKANYVLRSAEGYRPGTQTRLGHKGSEQILADALAGGARLEDFT